MTRPAARILADSYTEAGDRLTTFEVTMHRFVLAEFNTHRVFSRNSASSRAIPLAKQLDRVRTDPAVPVIWAAEQKGMQGGDEVENVDDVRDHWMHYSRRAADGAHGLGVLGVHKSIANRLLEPFMWHTVIVTATAWQNFFELRCNPLAQPEIKVVADLMRAAYRESLPDLRVSGEWHLPLIQDDEHPLNDGMPWDVAAKVSAARCARVSYLTHDGARDFEKDLQLYETLTSNGHSSPLEHVATPDPENAHPVFVQSRLTGKALRQEKRYILPCYGNFIGWHQLRWSVETERGYSAWT